MLKKTFCRIFCSNNQKKYTQKKSPRGSLRLPEFSGVSHFQARRRKIKRNWCMIKFSIVNGRLLFTCRTGNEKRRLILKSLIQNLKIEIPVRNSLLLLVSLRPCFEMAYYILVLHVSVLAEFRVAIVNMLEGQRILVRGQHGVNIMLTFQWPQSVANEVMLGS